MNKSNITLTALAFAIVVIIAETVVLVSVMAPKQTFSEIRKELVLEDPHQMVYNIYEKDSASESWKFKYVEGYNKPQGLETTTIRFPDALTDIKYKMFLKQPATRELFE